MFVNIKCRIHSLYSVHAGREPAHAKTVFANRAFHKVGGQWLGKTSLRPTPAHLLTARTPVHEDGGRERDAPHVLHDGGNSGTRTYWAPTRPSYLLEPT